MTRHVIVIEGPDADKAMMELISNAEFEKMKVLIWVSDKPDEDIVFQSTLGYSHIEEN